MERKRMLAAAIALVALAAVFYPLWVFWVEYSFLMGVVDETERSISSEDPATGIQMLALEAIETGNEQQGVFSGGEGETITRYSIESGLNSGLNPRREEDGFFEYSFHDICIGNQHIVFVELDCGPFGSEERFCLIEENFEAGVRCVESGFDQVLKTSNFLCTVSLKKTELVPESGFEEYSQREPPTSIFAEIISVYPSKISRARSVSFPDFVLSYNNPETRDIFYELAALPVRDIAIISTLFSKHAEINCVNKGTALFFPSGETSIEGELDSCISGLAMPVDYPTNDFPVPFLLDEEETAEYFEEVFSEWYSDWYGKVMEERQSDKLTALYRCETMLEAPVFGILDEPGVCTRNAKNATYTVANLAAFADGVDADFSVYNWIVACPSIDSEIDLDFVEQETGVRIPPENVSLDASLSDEITMLETENGFIIRNGGGSKTLGITLEKDFDEDFPESYFLEIGWA